MILEKGGIGVFAVPLWIGRSVSYGQVVKVPVTLTFLMVLQCSHHLPLHFPSLQPLPVIYDARRLSEVIALALCNRLFGQISA